MRLIFLFFLCLSLLGFYSCDNDLNSIGQNLIDNGNGIERQDILLEKTGTVKIDSFITSSGRPGNPVTNGAAITQMYMGRYQDYYGGTTRAYPCFQIAPVTTPSIEKRFNLDSVTFHFAYANKIWGDTLRPQPQTYELVQLSHVPKLKTDDYDFFYNTDSIPWSDEVLATVSFLPKKANMSRAYFKIPNTPYMLDLFDKMKYQDEIFRPSSTNSIRYYRFLSYFKGLALRAAGDNNCLMAIHALPDSLYMRFHYHDAETKLYYDLKLLTDSYVYQYNAIYTEPSAFLNSLKTQQNEVPFQTDKFALVQGLSGYMVKIEIPNPEILDPYKTVIKAEIEIKPYVWSTPPIAMPSTINVYTTNKINEIKEQLYNSSNSAVTGTYRIDPQNTENNRYIFDITDFYSRLTNTPSIVGNETKILLALPNLVSSYDQMVIKDIPVLRVYYATYKN